MYFRYKDTYTQKIFCTDGEQKGEIELLDHQEHHGYIAVDSYESYGTTYISFDCDSYVNDMCKHDLSVCF